MHRSTRATRPAAALAITLVVSLTGAARGTPGRQSEPPGLRYRMLVAEDGRAATREEAAPILEALGSPDSAIVRVAVRALGRLENPLFAPEIRRALNDNSPQVRAEAANALAQISASDVPGTLRALRDRLADESDALVRGALYDALGRVRYPSNDERKATEQVLAVALTDEFAPVAARLGAARGLDSLMRSARGSGFTAAPATLAALRREVIGSTRKSAGEDDRRVRRLALSALVTLGAVDDTFNRASVDRDPQIRRLALAGAGGNAPAELRDPVVAVGLRDESPMVALEALRVHGRHYAAADCGVEIEAARGADPILALGGIDLLATACPSDARATATLRDIARGLSAAIQDGNRTWHAPAHAIVSLARRAPDVARAELPAFAGHATWHVRMYAARAAAALKDGAVLERLAADAHANVREAAIAGLSTVRGREADALYVRALDQPDYQVVLAATAALKGTTERAPAAAAILKALGTITAQRRDTSRDARLALLERLREVGGASNAAALGPYLADTDPRVAALSAEILTGWTKQTVAPSTTRLKTLPLPPIQELRDLPAALRFTMASGRSFVVRLFVDETPVSVWRIVRLARAGYYNGLTIHRIVPNFVIQGGSPGANEFVGDGPFMRDEFGTRSQTRGTVGVSSRGRDTGDAQFYVNLIDNARLDHEYTIFGEVSEGMDVVDAILEGDLIAKVELLAK